MSDGTITETALRLRAEALIAANSAPLLDTGDLDGRLVEAERRFRASKERRRALFEEFQSEREAARFEEAVWDSEKVLLDVITQATPRTLAGAAAKLRVIVWRNDLGGDPEIEEVIGVLEREAPAVTAVPAAPGDGEILRLFREWIGSVHEADRIGRDENCSEEDHSEGVDAFLAIQDRIEEIPAQGSVGLAVKAYLAARWEHFPPAEAEESASIDPEAKSFESLLRDAARFVPEIAELAAPLIGRQPPQQR